jgi:hypothetical protein
VVALSGVYAAPLELSGGAVEDRCLEIACEIGIKIRTVESESQISRLILVAKIYIRIIHAAVKLG